MGPEVEESGVGETRLCGAEVVDGKSGLGDGEDRGETKACIRFVGVAEGEDRLGLDRFE